MDVKLCVLEDEVDLKVFFIVGFLFDFMEELELL